MRSPSLSGVVRPVAAADHAAVERDGDALRALDAGLLGLVPEQGVEVGRLALSRPRR